MCKGNIPLKLSVTLHKTAMPDKTDKLPHVPRVDQAPTGKPNSVWLRTVTCLIKVNLHLFWTLRETKMWPDCLIHVTF